MARAREEIFSALWAAQEFIGCKSEADVRVVRQHGKSATLVAARDLGARTVHLVPLVTSSLSVVAEKKTNAISLNDPSSALAGHAKLWLTQCWSDASNNKHGPQKEAFRPPSWAARPTNKTVEVTCDVVFVQVHGVQTVQRVWARQCK